MATPTSTSTSSAVVQRVSAYRHSRADGLRWRDPSNKSLGLDLDAMDAMYVLEPGVTYHLELCEETLEVLVMTNPEHKRSRARAFLREKGLKLKPKDFRRVNLTGWDLEDADLGRADLTGAVLRSATASRVNLTEAKLDGADLSYIDLSEANLYGASVKEAKFELATMTKVNLKTAVASGADFNHADAVEANMEQSRLDGANFSHAILSNASLVGASCRGVSFPTTRLTGASLEGAKFNRYRFLSSRMRPSPASLGISGRSLVAAGRLDENYESTLFDDLVTFQFFDNSDSEASDDEDEQEEYRNKPSGSTVVSIDSRKKSWLRRANELKNAQNPSHDWIMNELVSILMDMKESLMQDLRTEYDAALAQLKDIVLKEVATSISKHRSSSNAVADNAAVEAGDKTVSADLSNDSGFVSSKSKWKKSISTALSMNAFQKVPTSAKSSVEGVAKLRPLRMLYRCLRMVGTVANTLLGDGSFRRKFGGDLTQACVAGFKGLERDLQLEHVRRETEYCPRQSDGALSSVLLIWRLAAVSPNVLVRHIDEIDFISDQLDKIREPITNLNWKDALDNWYALADVLPKIRVRRGQLILESIFANPKVMKGLHWGASLYGIRDSSNPPPSLLSVLKFRLNKKLKEVYFEYVQELQVEKQRIVRVQELRAQVLALAASTFLAVLISIGNFVSTILVKIVDV